MFIFEVLAAFAFAGIIVYFIKMVQSRNAVIIKSMKYYVEVCNEIHVENKSQVNYILKMCKKYNNNRSKSENFDNTGLINISKVKEKIVI